MDFRDAGNALAHPVGDLAHMTHAFLGQRVHPALQLRHQVHLHRVENDSRRAQDRVLVEDEEQVGEENAALQSRFRDGIADEGAHRFGLGRDHGDDLALGKPLEVWQREAQDAFV